MPCSSLSDWSTNTKCKQKKKMVKKRNDLLALKMTFLKDRRSHEQKNHTNDIRKIGINSRISYDVRANNNRRVFHKCVHKKKRRWKNYSMNVVRNEIVWQCHATSPSAWLDNIERLVSTVADVSTLFSLKRAHNSRNETR